MTERGSQMKRSIIIALLILFVVPTICLAGSSNTRGYWRDSNKDGIKDTYVSPYSRTTPDSSRTNNYSYPGNYNPNRGEVTPPSSSPRETYPFNPNPYEKKSPYKRY